MRTVEYCHKVEDPRAVSLALAIGIVRTRRDGVFQITEVKHRKLDALIAAGFEVAPCKGNGVPRFRRNGGPMVLLSTALAIADAFIEGRRAAS